MGNDRQSAKAQTVGRGSVRLAKVMADRALCSRREAERLIAAGSVRVEGKVIDQGSPGYAQEFFMRELVPPQEFCVFHDFRSVN